jgi:Domain of unknown function (DUF4105)
MSMRVAGLVVGAWVAIAVAGMTVARAQPAHLRPDEVLGGAGDPTMGDPPAKPSGSPPPAISHRSIEADPPVIELVTFGVGERIFEKYGHAALCLRYHQPDHLPVCFNYGVTDFSAGAAMVWNFLRSQQRFWVEPTAQAAMMGFYEWEDRDIWVQTLPITGERARAIEAKLWRDIQEENRYYHYDHFRDNCTTRLRDMIDDATGGALRAAEHAHHALTFRQLGRRGLAEMPLLLVATDLVIGRETDEHPTMWQAMFLPDALRQEVADRLGAAPRLVYQRRGPAFPVDGPSGRLGVFGVAMAFALPLLFAQWRRRFERLALGWLTLGLSVAGLVVWGVAIASTIDAVRYNEVLLVVMPFDGVLLLLSAAGRRRYALVRMGLLAGVSLLGAVGVLHQPLWVLIVAVFVPLAIVGLDLPHGVVAGRGRAGAAVRMPPAAAA